MVIVEEVRIVKEYGNVVLNKDIHEFEKNIKETRLEKVKKVVKDFAEKNKSYKKLWEEQSKILDQKNLELSRKNKQIMRLKVKLDKLQKELDAK